MGFHRGVSILSINDYLVLFGLIIILALVFTIFDSTKKRRRFRFELPQIKTELICVSCGLREIRNFKEDDYISKITDEKCKKCGGNLKVHLIYAQPKREAM